MNDKTKFKLGDTLYIKMSSYNHYGIFDGKGNVIHNSKVNKKVCCEPLNVFSGGRTILINSKITSENREQTVQTAMLYLELPYDLFSNNCEHLVRIAHGLDKHSDQVERVLIAAVGAGLACTKDPIPKTIGQALVAGQAISSLFGTDPKITALIFVLVGLGIELLSSNEDKK